MKKWLSSMIMSMIRRKLHTLIGTDIDDFPLAQTRSGGVLANAWCILYSVMIRLQKFRFSIIELLVTVKAVPHECVDRTGLL